MKEIIKKMQESSKSAQSPGAATDSSPFKEGNSSEPTDPLVEKIKALIAQSSIKVPADSRPAPSKKPQLPEGEADAGEQSAPAQSPQTVPGAVSEVPGDIDVSGTYDSSSGQQNKIVYQNTKDVPIPKMKAFKVNVPEQMRFKQVKVNLKGIIKPEDLRMVRIRQVSDRQFIIYLPNRNSQLNGTGVPVLTPTGELKFMHNLPSYDVAVGSTKNGINSRAAKNK